MKIKQVLQNKSWKITVAMALLLFAGVMTLFSTGLAQGGKFFYENSEFGNQITFIILGLVFYVALMFFDYRYLKSLPFQIAIVLAMILPLLGVLVLGVTRNNATRWFAIGSVTIQPSEFAKVFLVLIMAFILTQMDRLPETTKGIISISVTILLATLIVVEPDLSTALIVLAMGSIMFLAYTKDQFFWFISLVSVVIYILIITGSIYLDWMPVLMVKIGPVVIDFLLLMIFVLAHFVLVLKFKRFRIFSLLSLITAVFLIASSTFFWNSLLRDYQRERILSFVQPDDNSENFQVEQAKIAIGSGQLLGKGFGHGTQSKLQFLPEQHTDFIFAAFAEEFGWIGAVILLFIYVGLILSVIEIASLTVDKFAFVVCVGVASMFLLETFINIGVNAGILPATGVPLPFMSLGGSSMWAKLMALGLVQSISVRSTKEIQGEKLKV